MMHYQQKHLFLSLMILIFLSVIVVAQTDKCPAIVLEALTSTDNSCVELGRNQACYGNGDLKATAQDNVSDFAFEQIGDQEDLQSIKSLQLSPMDTVAETWGVAMLKVQANIPDTIPGQNVTFLMFGDVAIDSGESKSEFPEDLEGYTPMQAFYFKTGIGDSQCAEAPDSGILIQTPKGVGQINLLVNEVSITLGSTAYLQAEADGDMLVNILDGHGTAYSFGMTVTIPAGTRVRIPIDADLYMAGRPSNPEPYDANEFDALPLDSLPDEIDIAPPLTQQDIDALSSPTPGIWHIAYDQQYIDVGCAADTYNDNDYPLELLPDGGIMWQGFELDGSGYGTYMSDQSANRRWQLTVLSPSAIHGSNTWVVDGCATIVNEFDLSLVFPSASPLTDGQTPIPTEAGSDDASSSVPDVDKIIPTSGVWNRTWDFVGQFVGCADTFENGEVDLQVNEDGSLSIADFPAVVETEANFYGFSGDESHLSIQVVVPNVLYGDYQAFSATCTYSNHFAMSLIEADS